MNKPARNIPELEFSTKYNREHAAAYRRRHLDGTLPNFSSRHEIAVARKALAIAGNPRSVLDLPSGTGRFWSMLAEDPSRRLYAADYSADMLRVALETQPEAISHRFEVFRASTFEIPLQDDFVDCLFCMRLLHHIGRREDRRLMLRELHRVTARSVVISLWVDGNFKSLRRARREQQRVRDSYQNRFVQPQARIEAEFRDAGFETKEHLDLLRFYSMWRIYVLNKR